MYRPSEEFLPSPELPSRTLTEEESRRARLVHLLRNPHLWPKRFMWDYEEPCHCAMEVLCQIAEMSNPWKAASYQRSVHFDARLLGRDLAPMVGLTPDQGDLVFIGAMKEFGEHEEVDWCDVTPSRVADLIEHLAPIPAARS